MGLRVHAMTPRARTRGRAAPLSGLVAGALDVAAAPSAALASTGAGGFVLPPHDAATVLDWLLAGPGLIPALSWIAVLAWLLAFAAFVVWRRPSGVRRDAWHDLLVFVAVTSGALAIRLLVPSGPLNFAEAERVAVAWSRHPQIQPTFESIPLVMGLARCLGFGADTILHFTGPLVGALGAGFAYLLARSAGLSRAAALLAGVLVATWPAHVRYSGSAAMSIGAATLWTAAFATALWERLPGSFKVPLLTALVVLGVHQRPECRLLAVAIVPLVFTPGWSWRDRGVFAVALGAALLPYALANSGLDESRGYASWAPLVFARWLARDTSISPLWWALAGVLGVVVGRTPWQLRLTMLLTLASLALTYAFGASEQNPFWGQWRYVVTAVPIVSVGAASLADRLPAFRRRDAVLLGVTAATLLSSLLFVPALVRPIDAQVELAYLRETAPRIAATNRYLVLLSADRQAQIRYESVAVMALGEALGPVAWPGGAGTPPPFEGHGLWTQEALLSPRPGGPDLTRTAIFLGMYRPDPEMLRLRERFELVPLDEREVAVAPMLQLVNTQCVIPCDTYLGASIPDCNLKLGWYRPVALARPSPE